MNLSARQRKWIIGLTIALGVALMLNGFADRLFYVPSKTNYEDPGNLGLNFEEAFFFNEAGNRLHGYLFKPTGDAKPHATVVHVHGNAGNVTNHFLLPLFLVENGFQVFCFDYRGYGRSEGRVSRKGLQNDVSSAVDYIKQRDDVDDGRLLLFGQSLGGAMSVVEASRRDDIRGIVIEAAFTSYYAIARDVMLRTIILAPLAPFLPYLLLSPGLHPVDHVRQFNAPVLFIHGNSDSVVPWRMSVELHEKAPQPKRLILIDGMNHLEGPRHAPEKYSEPIIDFYHQCLGKESNTKGSTGI